MVLGIKKFVDNNIVLCYFFRELFGSYKPEKFYMRGPRIK